MLMHFTYNINLSTIRDHVDHNVTYGGITYSSYGKISTYRKEVGVYKRFNILGGAVYLRAPCNDSIFSGSFMVRWSVDVQGEYSTWVEVYNRSYIHETSNISGYGCDNYSEEVTVPEGVYYVVAKTSLGDESNISLIAVDPMYNPKSDEINGRFVMRNGTVFREYATLCGYAYSTYNPLSVRLNSLEIDILEVNQSIVVRDEGGDILNPGYFMNDTFVASFWLGEGKYTAVLKGYYYVKDPELRMWVGPYEKKLSQISFSIDDTPPYVCANITNGSYYNDSTMHLVMEFSDPNIAYYNYSLFSVDANITMEYGEGNENATVMLNVSLDDGEYLLHLYACDAAKDRCNENLTQYRFFVDTTKPNISIFTPRNGSCLGGLVEIAISSVDQNWDIAWLEINGSVVATWIQDGNFTFLWNTTEYQDGLYIVVAYCRDKASNVAWESIYVRVDNTRPVVSILCPKNGSSVRGCVIINISCYDENPNSTCLVINGSTHAIWVGCGNLTYLWNTSLCTNGNYVIYVYANDTVGNMACSMIIVTVRQFEVDAYVDSGIINVTEVVVCWCWNGTVYTPLAYVYLNGSIVGEVQNNNSYTIRGLGEGYWKIEVILVDLTTNNSDIDIIFIRVDTSKPIIIISYPEDNSYINTTCVRVEWNASDNVGIATYAYKVDDGDWINVGMNDSVMINLPEGVHYIYVRAVDVAGNMETVHVLLHVDITAPRIAILEPSNNSYINSTDVQVEWVGLDNVGISGYILRVNNGSYKYVGLVSEYELELLVGVNIVEIIASDLAGNRVAVKLFVCVDLEPPRLIIIEPKNYSVLMNNNTMLIWMGIDDNGVGYYIVKYGGHRHLTGGTNMTLFLKEGKNIVFICVVDKAGNRHCCSIILYVDTMPPEITIVAPNNDTYINSSEVKIEWIVFEANPVSFEVQVDDNEWITANNESWHLVHLDEGRHIITVRITDISGRHDISTINIFIDLSSPRIRVIRPKNKSVVYGGRVVVELSIADNMEVDKAWIELSGNTISIVGKQRVTIHIHSGENTIRLYVVDKAGNKAECTLLIIGVDVLQYLIILAPGFTLGVVVLRVARRKRRSPASGDKGGSGLADTKDTHE